MAFSSLDHILQKVTTDNFSKSHLAYTTGTISASRWYDLSANNRDGSPNAWAGTALTWQTCDEATGNGTQSFGIPHGGNVSPETKHILTAATHTLAVGHAVLVDIQGYWPGISTNSASTQTLSGTPTLRYANGAGCNLYFVSTVASGATAHNISLNYTNSAGTGSRTLSRTVAMTPSAVVGHISHSGTAANNYGPFLPLATGDLGVQNVANVTFSAASGAGTGALVLAKPLLTVYMPSPNLPSERDLISNFPSLPRVRDGACLSWIFYTYSTSASLVGYLDFAWA